MGLLGAASVIDTGAGIAAMVDCRGEERFGGTVGRRLEQILLDPEPQPRPRQQNLGQNILAVVHQTKTLRPYGSRSGI